MLRLVVTADSWIQKKFDAVVHEAMRRFGWTKRSIRRHVWSCMAACILIQNVIKGTLWVGLLVSLLYVAAVLFNDFLDSKAEQANFTVRSAADTQPVFAKLWGLFIAASSIPGLLVMPLSWCIFEAVYWLAWMCHAYLISTDPQAPKKQKQEDKVPNLVFADV